AATNRTQISTLPAARTVTQNASLTVSRAPQTTPTTVSYHVSNRVSATPVVAANLQATTRATINGPIRISTPPIQVATNNNTTTYVQRQPQTVVPSRSVTAGTATAATIISQSSSGATTTLVPNFQMSTPLFRAGSIGAGAGQVVAAGAPRARVVTQTTLSANHHQVTGVSSSTGGGGGGAGGGTTVVTPGGGTTGGTAQAVAISSASVGGSAVPSSGSGTGTGQSQALVATLSAVLQGPRQVSTLLYTNNSNAQQYTIGPNQQRLALATTLSPQRPQATVTTGIRPTIQRLPTAGIRVSTGSLNFRSPVLASTTVLTTIASNTGTVGTVTNTQQQQQVQQQAQQQLQQQQRTVTATGTATGATAISNAIPARIIQVQNPPSGTTGTAQIVNRLQTNLVNIQPLIVSNSRLPQSGLQPAGITIAQVGKLTQVATAAAGATGNDGSGAGGNAGTGSGTTTTLQTASGQQIVVSTGGAGPGGGGGGSPATAIIAGNLIAGNHSASQAVHQGQITQIVNVNAGQPTVVSAAVSSGQQQQQQIVTVSQAGGGSATTGTVIPLPLALTSARNVGAAGAGTHSPLSIVTGGIVRTAGGAAGAGGATTSIASVLPIAKVTPQQQQQQQTLVTMESSGAGSVTQHYSVASSGGVSGGPSLYIQTRPGGTGLTGAGGKAGGATGATLSVVSSGPSGAGGAGSGSVGSAPSATTFLPTSTFYYERLTSSPATSVPSSTAAVAISSTGIPVSSATFVQAVAASSSSSSTITTASAISGPVFSIPASSSVINSSGGGGGGGASGNNTTVVTVAAAGGNPTLAPYGSTGSFAIVQASPAGARTATLATGPVHGIVPASVQTAPAAVSSVSQPTSGVVSAASSGTTAQIVPIRFHSQMLIDSSGQTQQIIVSSGGGSGGTGGGGGTSSIVPIIPVGTGGAATAVVTATSKQQESPQSSILRKRTLVETTSGSMKATPVGKDLTAALMAVERERSVREQQEAQLHLLQQQQQHHHLVAELRDLANASPLHHSRPPSTDGSTTVSATSSPGLDEQEEEELRAQAYANRASNAVSGDGHFKPVQDDHHFFQQQQQQQQQQQEQQQQQLREILSLHCTESFPTNLGTSTTLSVVSMTNHTSLVSIGGGSSNGGAAGSYEQSPRKKARKQLLLPMTDGHHQHHHLSSVKSNSSSSSSSSSSSVVTNSSTSSTNTTVGGGGGGGGGGQQQHPYLNDDRMDTGGSGLVVLGPVGATGANSSGTNNASSHPNKHNSNNIGSSSALSNNLHNNSTSNSVRMDPPAAGSVTSGSQVGSAVISVVAARQPNLTLRKPHNISLLQSYKQTWKSANNHFQRYTDVKQREERRPTVMDIANQSHILQKLNGWKIYHLSAQIEDLGNMQRSKIIIDGINEARTQIMKIFQHKPHVSDIILRCASKRNFKKREKT
uniref:Histone deacetylase complex subunit SAP130 C-terminal domain-containing protein n=1 Tax=Anopheles maculatus TaxID=74869 RepID=A0A182SAM6_9DIPT